MTSYEISAIIGYYRCGVKPAAIAILLKIEKEQVEKIINNYLNKLK